MRQNSEIHQHSGWLIPLGLFATIVALSAIFLLYYLRPIQAAFRNSPTAQSTRVTLAVQGMRFSIPANYLESRTVGGDVGTVAVFALLPDMRGYSDADRTQFAGDAADSALLHLLIRADPNGMDAADRFERIYRPYFSAPAGAAAPFALTRYDFRADSGYGRDELFVGTDAARGVLLLLCERPAQDVPSPNCLAIDRPITPGINLSYRFKRSQLGRWREISAGATKLVSGFLKP